MMVTRPHRNSGFARGLMSDSSSSGGSPFLSPPVDSGPRGIGAGAARNEHTQTPNVKSALA